MIVGRFRGRGPRITYVRDDAYTGKARKNRNRAPATGSREHYFHFLIGYLLPLIHAQRQRAAVDDGFAVLDCGPLMTPLLEQTLTRMRKKLGSFTVVAPAGVTNPVYVEPWDQDWNKHDDGAAVKETVSAVMEAWQDDGVVIGMSCCSQPDCPSPDTDALLLERSPAPDFYLEHGAAERPGYGLSRRGVVNWPEVHAHLEAQGIAHAMYEPGRHSLGCQIASFRRARRIVGIRGAEWANLIWCRPGDGALRVRLLDPDPPARLLGGLVERLGLDCRFVPVEGTAPREDPVAVAQFLTSPR